LVSLVQGFQLYFFTATTQASDDSDDSEDFTTQAPTNSECSEPKLSGPCRAAIPRFYFDTESGKCDKFSWGGCQPNSNNFKTLEECSTKCLGGEYTDIFFFVIILYNCFFSSHS
jgi:hypothetical protein